MTRRSARSTVVTLALLGVAAPLACTERTRGSAVTSAPPLASSTSPVSVASERAAFGGEGGAELRSDASTALADAGAKDEATARAVLFPDASDASPLCDGADHDARVRCLLEARYKDDLAARDLALDLFARTTDVAGLEREQQMDGGYRGMLHLVPALPVGKERAHLARVSSALLDYERFFTALGTGDGGALPRYRTRGLALRFFRSVKARTPSAYAVDWTVAYNVAGSLNGDADSVRETLFHEIFHLNDADHGAGARDWSDVALAPLYDKIVGRCGTSVACLAPYAPNGTMVRGGTYYAFQPGNDVREYAAELAIRYYKEQRGALGQGPRIAPAFKCGRAENATAWRALVGEFFAGIDRVPPCAR